MANRQYDQTSGQIFRQWTLDQRRLRPSVQELGWSKLNKHRYGRDLDPRAKGPRSLLDMAASIVVRNFGHVTEQHLETIPLSLRRCIWEFLQERGPSLHAWKTMSNSLRQAEVDNTALSLHRFMYQVRTPRLDLPLYTAPLTSPDLSFVAHLAILGGCTLSSADLLCLADMPNLGVLELMRPTLGNYAFPQVTDRLIRGWTEAPAPFPQLRVLRIWGTAVSPESLPWAARLPSLYIYDIAGSNDIWDYEEDVPSGDAVWTNASSKADQWRDESSCLCYVAVKDTVPTPEGATEEIPVRRVEYGSAELLAVCLEMDDFWDMYDEESWGFWAYSAVGQFTGDADLPRSSLTWQTVVKADGLEYVLPTVPMATLALGCYNRRNDPAVERRRTFVRTGTAEPPKPTRQPSPEKERQTKPSKRRRMDDMLSGLMG